MTASSHTSKKHIETYVFFDIEATGLPQEKPKITEVCFIAINRASLESEVSTSSSSDPKPEFPRVVDKLCICVDPGKPINQKSSEITGLTNEMLEKNKKEPFSLDISHLLKSFLKRQVKPICLVAHNGNTYDFPLLKAELTTISSPVLEDAYCIDSLVAMKAVDKAAGEHCSSYRLSELYFRFFQKKPENSHFADDDVITLIQVFQCKAAELMEWSEKHCELFSNVKPMDIRSKADSSTREGGSWGSHGSHHRDDSHSDGHQNKSHATSQDRKGHKRTHDASHGSAHCEDSH